MLAMYQSAQNVQVGGAPVLSSLHKCLHIVISQLKLVNKLGGGPTTFLYCMYI